MLSRMMLSKPQRDALAVLAATPDAKMESWTRSSTMGHTVEHPLAPPRVNIRAVRTLVQMKLVRWEMSANANPYVNHDKFQITDLGLEVHRS